MRLAGSEESGDPDAYFIRRLVYRSGVTVEKIGKMAAKLFGNNVLAETLYILMMTKR